MRETQDELRKYLTDKLMKITESGDLSLLRAEIEVYNARSEDKYNVWRDYDLLDYLVLKVECHRATRDKLLPILVYILDNVENINELALKFHTRRAMALEGWIPLFKAKGLLVTKRLINEFREVIADEREVIDTINRRINPIVQVIAEFDEKEKSK